MLDQYAEFVHGMPGWIIQDGPERGHPLSWHHFRYGLAYLRRKQARDELAAANAYRINKGKDEDYKAWRNDLQMLAGYQ